MADSPRRQSIQLTIKKSKLEEALRHVRALATLVPKAKGGSTQAKYIVTIKCSGGTHTCEIGNWGGGAKDCVKWALNNCRGEASIKWQYVA